ncbi:hypothetical protein E3N88_00769 [Mikania micrantha]|uniref:Uncharacterized protein n=1 Tax=Mikania micrantha TaxID=192012 RepID=A0A5N6PZT4_9ASTR|nr:hypothetical protein E3N88_00769 [Mikania micrantha]
MTPQWWIDRGAVNCLRWKYRWVNILRLKLYMTPQWWIDRDRGAVNCLRWKYRWVNILRLKLYMTPQWWIDRGAVNCLRWKYRWVNILRLKLYMTPQWWIDRGAGNCLRWKYRLKMTYTAVRIEVELESNEQTLLQTAVNSPDEAVPVYVMFATAKASSPASKHL